MIYKISIVEARIFFACVSFLCLFIKTYYYLKIKHDKSLGEFIMDLFRWAPKIVIKNSGADKDRRTYMRKNNYLAVYFWISVFIQLFLLFYKPTTD